MPTNIQAATSTTGAVLDPSAGDGQLVIKTGATAGAQVNALSFAADGTPTFLKAPTSGIFTITTSQTTPLPAVASLLSYTHGLGVVPVSAELEIVCLTAELGYSIGDVVTPYTSSSAGIHSSFSIRKTATVVEARTGSNVSFIVNNHTTGTGTTATAANWAWRFKVRTV